MQPEPLNGCSKIIITSHHSTPGMRLELTQEILANNRRRMISDLRITCEDKLHDLETTTSLLDLLPEFISLISTLTTYCKDEKDMWGEYTAEFMLQASLEQFYIYGSTKASMVDEAFAWDRVGLVGHASEGKAHPKISPIEIVSEDQKAQYRGLLFPDQRISWNWHLRQVAKNLPLPRFEEAILDLLKLLLNFLQKPILTQLEEGKLDSLSRSETTEFKKRVGFA
jgi:hypothetical protein